MTFAWTKQEIPAALQSGLFTRDLARCYRVPGVFRLGATPMAYGNEPGNGDSATVEDTARESCADFFPTRVTQSRHYHLPAWATIAVTLSCVLILLTTAMIPNPGSLRSNTGSSGIKEALSNPAPPLEFPYAVSPTLYPMPSNLTPSTAPSGIHLAATPGGTDYLLFENHSATQLWLSSSWYNALDAQALDLGWKCLQNKTPCVATQSVYLSWNTPLRVFTASATVTADALASTGSTLVFAATVGGTTTVLSSYAGGTPTVLGNVTGTVTSLTANSEDALLTTISSGKLEAATLSLNGGVVWSPTLASSGIQNASAAWVPTPSGQAEAVVASNPTTGKILAFSSTNGGESFSAGTAIGTLNETALSPILNRIGSTMLYPSG